MLAQYSTDRYAGGLYCRVRNGTGCDPAAMAVIPKHGISAKYIKLTESEEPGSRIQGVYGGVSSPSKWFQAVFLLRTMYPAAAMIAMTITAATMYRARLLLSEEAPSAT